MKTVIENKSNLENDLTGSLALLANLIQLGQCSETLATDFHPDYAVYYLNNFNETDNEC